MGKHKHRHEESEVIDLDNDSDAIKHSKKRKKKHRKKDGDSETESSTVIPGCSDQIENALNRKRKRSSDSHTIPLVNGHHSQESTVTNDLSLEQPVKKKKRVTFDNFASLSQPGTSAENRLSASTDHFTDDQYDVWLVEKPSTVRLQILD